MMCPQCEIEMKMMIYDGTNFNFKCPKCNLDLKKTAEELEKVINDK